MNFALDLIKGIIFTILIWLIFFPVVMVLATPVILLVCVWEQPKQYLGRVASGYCSVFEFWLDNGLWCTPWGAPH